MPIPKPVKKLILRTIAHIPVLDRTILASAGYKVLTRDEAWARSASLSGWHSERSAQRQDQAYERLLSNLRAGNPRIDLAVAATAVKATGLTDPTLIEIGCGNGYYSEVFRRLVPGVRYTGLDYSAAMVKSAQQRYPQEQFRQGDATKLSDADNSFDIVFDGVSLMHILEYRRAITEAARVAKAFVILHSVPVFDDHETVYFSKYAYGEPVVEMVFGRRELEDLLSKAGLKVRQTWPSVDYDVADVIGVRSRCLTYLAEKNRG